jgi:hypothetical protein
VAAAVAAVSPAARAATSGSFLLEWTDRVGNTHPLVSTQVSLYDVNVSPGVNNLIGTWVTDANGRLNFSTNYARPGGGALQVQLDVKAIVTNVGQFGPSYGDTYTYRMPATYAFNLNSAGTTYDAGAVTNGSDGGKAIGFLQGLKVANDYYESLGAQVSWVTGRFGVQWGNGSYMNGWNMTLGYDSWGAWDVALHEYGHGLANANNLHIQPAIGYAHSFNQDSISAGPALGAALGTQLAWQEGIATYLGTSALNHRLPTAIPGMPASDSDAMYNRFTSVGMTTPDVYLTATSFAVNLENHSGIALQYQTDAQGALVKDADGKPIPVIDGNGNYVHQTYNTIVGRGEGDELSVARVLWDLDDDTPGEALRRAGRTDQISLGGQGVFNLLKAAGQGNNGRLIDLWRVTRQSYGTTPLMRSLLGDIFEANSVSSIPGVAGGALDGGVTEDARPVLAWTPQNAGHSTKFLVAVYSLDWSTLMELSPQIDGLTSWQLLSPLDPGTYNWVVISNSVMQSTVSFDDSYWSGGATFTIIPEPAVLLCLVGVVPVLMLRRRAAA